MSNEDSLEPLVDPRKVYEEARLYAGIGRYDKALEKHLWFHRHALELRPSLAGVRLSYALRDWVAVGRVYSPALEALMAVRGESEGQVRTEDDVRHPFMDVCAINRALDDVARNYELFKWLDSERRDLAQDVYDVAQKYVVQAGDYSICDHYLAPKEAIRRFRMHLEARRSFANKRNNADGFTGDWASTSFERDVLTLVALLVLNHRQEEAEWTRDEALRDHDTPAFRLYLDRAMTGELFVLPQQRE